MNRLVSLRSIVIENLSRLGIGISRISSLQQLRSIPTQVHEALLSKSLGVIHIGGHFAEERETYLKHNLPIIWIEGVPNYAKQIQEGIKDASLEQVRQVFLGEVSQESVPFYITNNSGSSSSLLRLKNNGLFPGLETEATIVVDVFRFDQVFTKFEIQGFDHLVLDVQGAELSVLKGMGDYIDTFRFLKIEVSTVEIYLEAPMFSEIQDFLAEKGFVTFWRPSGNFHGDILFVRL